MPTYLIFSCESKFYSSCAKWFYNSAMAKLREVSKQLVYEVVA